MSTVTQYYLRAFDDGPGGRQVWVYWNATNPTAVPAPTTTNPNYTGTLSAQMIVFQYQQSSQGFGGIVFQNYVPLNTLTPKPIMTWSKGNLPDLRVQKLHLYKYENVYARAYDQMTDTLVFSGSAVQVT